MPLALVVHLVAEVLDNGWLVHWNDSDKPVAVGTPVVWKPAEEGIQKHIQLVAQSTVMVVVEASCQRYWALGFGRGCWGSTRSPPRYPCRDSTTPLGLLV